MGMIKLARVDYRLIHGQVVTKWVKIARVQQIIIIDDILSKEEFMQDVYKMAAPPGISVSILSVEEAYELYYSNQFENKDTMLLFKEISSAYQTYMRGIKFDSLQLGGIPSNKTRKSIFNSIALDSQDIKVITELNEQKCRVYIHIVPEEPTIECLNIISKFNS